MIKKYFVVEAECNNEYSFNLYIPYKEKTIVKIEQYKLFVNGVEIITDTINSFLKVEVKDLLVIVCPECGKESVSFVLEVIKHDMYFYSCKYVCKFNKWMKIDSEGNYEFI